MHLKLNNIIILPVNKTTLRYTGQKEMDYKVIKLFGNLDCFSTNKTDHHNITQIIVESGVKHQTIYSYPSVYCA